MRVDTFEGLDALEQPDVQHVLAHVAYDRGVRQDIEHAPLALVTTGTAMSATFAARDGDQACGYAQLGRDRHGWVFEYAVLPRYADHVAVGTALVDAARAVVDSDWLLWLSAPKPDDDAIATSVGLRVNRELFQLRAALPRPDAVSVTTRPFVVGRDDATWLDVNNRAFAWHPDQSEWTEADLTARFGEPWFDAEGFLVHESEGRLDGFCWTKHHEEYDPPIGEIYVIAKDPDAKEHGLGKQLTLAGLAYLAGTGLREAMLYVDASNTKALDMYEAMGFTTHHVDRNYVVDTPTKAPTP